MKGWDPWAVFMASIVLACCVYVVLTVQWLYGLAVLMFHSAVLLSILLGWRRSVWIALAISMLVLLNQCIDPQPAPWLALVMGAAYAGIPGAVAVRWMNRRLRGLGIPGSRRPPDR